MERGGWVERRNGVDRRGWIGWTVNGRRLAWMLSVAVALGAFAVAVRLYDSLQRLRLGVKPGVTLEGFPMGGLLPAELNRRLQELQVRLRQLPTDARWDPSTATALPERPGRELDVAETRRRLLSARPYQRVSPAYITVLPSISRRHFQPIYRGRSDRPWVALAFNVDWGQEHLGTILDELDRHRVRGTFFLTGRWARQFPEMARQIARRGHEIGNHGMDHLHPKELSDQQLRRLILDAEKLLESITSQRPRLFAPPYGEVDGRIVAIAAELGYYTVMWTVDTLDWQRPPPQAIVERVSERLVNGSIILMHPTEPTAQALPRVLQILKERGLQPVTVGHLAAELGSERKEAGPGHEGSDVPAGQGQAPEATQGHAPEKTQGHGHRQAQG